MISLENFDLGSPWAAMIFFVLGVIMGDNLFIALGFIYAQGYSQLVVPVIFLFSGVVIADYFYYLIGRSEAFEKLKKIKIVGFFFNRVDNTIEMITANHVPIAFYYCKFITGAKFLIDAYLGKKKVGHFYFVYMTLIAAVVWSTFAFLVGYLTGKGFIFVLDLFQSFSLGLLFIFVFIAVFFSFGRKAKQYIGGRYKTNSH